MPLVLARASDGALRGLRLFLAVLATTLPLAAAPLHPARAEPEPEPDPAAPALTVERMLGSPALSGPRAMGVKFSPDGRFVSYLKGKAENADRNDLWVYDIARNSHRLLIDSAQFQGPDSEAEKARRERQRIRATGIVSYAWDDKSARLLFPIAGEIYVVQPGDDAPPRRLDSASGAPAVDVRFAPGGRYVSCVRGGNLYLYDLQDGGEKALTRDGGDAVSFGTAEFAAQEELKRETGYWWSPDGRYIAYTRVDETAVPVVNRSDYGASGVTVVPQRYPFAGGPNARVTLQVLDVATGAVRAVDLGDPDDYYLARVDWRSDAGGEEMLVQRLQRDQKRLDLLAVDPASGALRTLLQERSATWVSLHNDLLPLPDGRFVWSSERTGWRHLYLYDREGRTSRPLTAGEWPVDALAGRDEDTGRLLFTGFRDGPLDRQIYSVSLEDGPASVTPLTREAGWHGIVLARHGGAWLHSFSSPRQPPQVALVDRAGRQLTWVLENRLDAGHPYAPYLSGRIEPEYGTLKADDGSTLHYMMLVPPGARSGHGRLPAIMHAYGGPAGQLVSHAWGDAESGFLQVLARNGYVVMVLDGRGTPNRGRAFLDQIYHAAGTVEVRDQERGAEYLKSLPFVDPAHVGFFGHSYGGYLALAMLTRAPGTYAAAIAVAPVTDWHLYDTAYTERYLGNPSVGPEAEAVYASAAIQRDLKNIKGRLMLIHGMADDNVFFDNSTRLIRALQQQGTLFDLMTYPGERHGFYDVRENTQRYRTMLEFFDRQLKPGRHTVTG